MKKFNKMTECNICQINNECIEFPCCIGKKACNNCILKLQNENTKQCPFCRQNIKFKEEINKKLCEVRIFYACYFVFILLFYLFNCYQKIISAMKLVDERRFITINDENITPIVNMIIKTLLLVSDFLLLFSFYIIFEEENNKLSVSNEYTLVYRNKPFYYIKINKFINVRESEKFRKICFGSLIINIVGLFNFIGNLVMFISIFIGINILIENVKELKNKLTYNEVKYKIVKDG